MSKVTLKVEIDEETYKQIKDDSVYDSNNKVIISNSSSAYYALNAIINATPITEPDDAVSRQVVKEQMLKYGFHAPDMTVTEFVEDLPPVTPKREHGEWKMIYRHHNEVKKYTGTDLMGDKHTIYVHEEYEGKEPYCSKCGKRADDLGQSFCGYCGAEMR